MILAILFFFFFFKLGSFGVVFKAQFNDKAVACKMFEESAKSQEKEFVAEAKIMATIPPHSNVVQLIGFSAQPAAILTEFLNGGSLKDFLENPEATFSILIGKNLKELNFETDNIGKKIGVQFLRDVAAGLGHLHENNIVHRDMAARNVLIRNSSALPLQNANPKDFTCLVSDMGKNISNFLEE